LRHGVTASTHAVHDRAGEVATAEVKEYNRRKYAASSTLSNLEGRLAARGPRASEVGSMREGAAVGRRSLPDLDRLCPSLRGGSPCLGVVARVMLPPVSVVELPTVVVGSA